MNEAEVDVKVLTNKLLQDILPYILVICGYVNMSHANHESSRRNKHGCVEAAYRTNQEMKLCYNSMSQQ